MDLYQHIIKLLTENCIVYREFEHDPIITYEDALKQAQKHGFHGTESKNVFIKDNSGQYYVYITIAGRKIDFKKLKENLGIKATICHEEEVRNVIHCVPGCVVPFGFDELISIIIDRVIDPTTDYLFSPGVTTKTIQTNYQDLKKIWGELPNRILYI